MISDNRFLVVRGLLEPEIGGMLKKINGPEATDYVILDSLLFFSRYIEDIAASDNNQPKPGKPLSPFLTLTSAV